VFTMVDFDQVEATLVPAEHERAAPGSLL